MTYFAEAVKMLFAICLLMETTLGHHSHDHDGPMSSSELEHLALHSAESGDLNKLAEEELRFLYFKMHDSDLNDLLDGCELVKSLLHFHSDQDHQSVDDHRNDRIFSNAELSMMVDPILASDDVNCDGFIDYPEFVAAQISRGL